MIEPGAGQIRAAELGWKGLSARILAAFPYGRDSGLGRGLYCRGNEHWTRNAHQTGCAAQAVTPTHAEGEK